MDNRLGAALRHRREVQQMSLRDVAEALGLSAQYWSQVELGRKSVSMGRLIQVSKLLGVDAAELMRLETSAPLEEIRARAAGDESFSYALRLLLLGQVPSEEIISFAADAARALPGTGVNQDG